MSRVKNFLLENETYEDGLKRALRCWAVQSEKLEALEAENKRLREFAEFVQSRYFFTRKLRQRADAALKGEEL